MKYLIQCTFAAGFQEASLCGDSGELAPSNPFLQIQQKETPFDLAMQAVQVIARGTDQCEEKQKQTNGVLDFILGGTQ